MNFLFDTIILYHLTPVFYRIFKIGTGSYYAIPTDENMRPFKLKKDFGHWISEGGYSHYLAMEVGKEIDRTLCGIAPGTESIS